MKLNLKWFVWFSGIGIYVMLLGGVFYYNLFKWTFDEKLKSEILEMVTLKSPDLLDGLLRSPSLTIKELGVMQFFKNDKRITDILYLDEYIKIRWFRHGKYLGYDFDSFAKETNYDTASIWKAYQTGNPSIVSVKKQPFYDIAIPFKAQGDELIGVINLRVSREGSKQIIGSAMRKYVVGALGVLVLLGIPLSLFLKYYIVNPINSLSDSIEGISSKSFEIKFASRSDEIGRLAQTVVAFLDKVKQEMEFASGREDQRKSYEHTWWEVVLNTITAKGSKALVIDEDNNVLFANFSLNRLDPEQKLHLLDVIDTGKDDILKMVGVAMENPQKIVEADTIFKSEPVHAKVVQMQSEGALRRTLIFFESKQV
jgi:HAMP domain-containing protein